MTTAFTHAQSHGPDMCDAIGSPSRAFPSPTGKAPAVSKENTDPHCTPPSSPSKQARPSTPKSTPLHRRFLKEVSMSPASPATPATPPRTPSRNQRDTPTKDRDSPTKVRPTPTQDRGSPAKLEIGQNGFYFSMEIPMSKITPKKQTSPQKASRAGTPTRRTPSPLKNETDVKRNPAKALFGTPTRKAVDITKSRAGTPAMKSLEDGSPAWTSSKIHSRDAEDLMIAPVAPLRNPPVCLPDVVEKHAVGANAYAPPDTTSDPAHWRPSSAHSAKDSRPENIGHMMARLTSGSFKTYDWAKAHHGVDPIKSPAPTPLRQASQKFYSVAPPSFLKMDIEKSKVAVDEPTKSPVGGSPLQLQEPHLPNVKYFDESKRVKSQAMKWERMNTTPKPNPAGAKATIKKPSKGGTTLDEVAKVQPSAYPELLFPNSVQEVDRETAKNTSSHDPEKHVQLRGPIFSPSKSIYQPMSSHRRAGTDPEVYLAMQRDMASMGESLRRSIGSVLSSSRLNTNELPTMSNTIFMRELDAEKPKAAPVTKARGRLTRWNSDTPAVCSPRPDTLKQRAATLTGPSVPMWQQSGSAPVQVLREKIATSKERSAVASTMAKAATAATPRSRPPNAISKKPSKAPSTQVATPRRQVHAAGPATTPARPAFGTPAKKQIPAAAPFKTKAGTPATPRTPRVAAKSRTPHMPAARATTSSKPSLSSRKPIPKTPRPTPARHLAKPPTPPPYDPADPRPYGEKFASAAVIAERVTQWHNEERRKAAAAFEAMKSPSKSPDKAVPKAAINVVKATGPTINSSTPTGSPTKQPPFRTASPTKLPIRTASPAKPATTKTFHTPANPLSTRPPPKHPTHTPRKPIPHLQPKTPLPPALRTPNLKTNKTITPFNPRTPIHAPNSRIAVLDRNAFRTPSKAIQSSLDRAIDEKIRQDERIGRAFMLGGRGVGCLQGEEGEEENKCEM